jgi:integral membrane sensor domain MASE1
MDMNIWALIIVIMLYIYFNIYAVNKCIVIQYIDPDAKIYKYKI